MATIAVQVDRVTRRAELVADPGAYDAVEVYRDVRGARQRLLTVETSNATVTGVRLADKLTVGRRATYVLVAENADVAVSAGALVGRGDLATVSDASLPTEATGGATAILAGASGSTARIDSRGSVGGRK